MPPKKKWPHLFRSSELGGQSLRLLFPRSIHLFWYWRFKKNLTMTLKWDGTPSCITLHDFAHGIYILRLWLNQKIMTVTLLFTKLMVYFTIFCFLLMYLDIVFLSLLFSYKISHTRKGNVRCRLSYYTLSIYNFKSERDGMPCESLQQQNYQRKKWPFISMEKSRQCKFRPTATGQPKKTANILDLTRFL